MLHILVAVHFEAEVPQKTLKFRLVDAARSIFVVRVEDGRNLERAPLCERETKKEGRADLVLSLLIFSLLFFEYWRFSDCTTLDGGGNELGSIAFWPTFLHLQTLVLCTLRLSKAEQRGYAHAWMDYYDEPALGRGTSEPVQRQPHLCSSLLHSGCSINQM